MPKPSFFFIFLSCSLKERERETERQRQTVASGKVLYHFSGYLRAHQEEFRLGGKTDIQQEGKPLQFPKVFSFFNFTNWIWVGSGSAFKKWSDPPQSFSPTSNIFSPSLDDSRWKGKNFWVKKGSGFDMLVKTSKNIWTAFEEYS